MIKRIDLISKSTSKFGLFRFQFYTKINGELAIFNPGKCTKATTTTAVFEKLTATSKRANNYTNGLANILTGGSMSNTASFNAGVIGDTISITFNEGLRVLYGFYYTGNAYFANNIEIKIYDEHNRVIYYEPKPVLTASTNTTSISFYETKELELMKVYPTNTIGVIETNDNTQIKDVYRVEGITVEQNTPEGTDMKYLVSFDGRKTYKTYKNGVWSEVDISNSSNIMELGLSKTEIEAINSDEFNEAVTEDRTVDVLTGMVTNSEYVTPSISQVKVLYLKIV